jgi:hypothetical protein
VTVSLDSRGLERRFEMGELLDPNDAPGFHPDDAGPAAEEVRTPALKRPIVGRIDLHPREAHAHDDAIRKAERAIDGDVVVLGDPFREYLEHAVTADENGLLPGGDPLDARIEHLLHRGEVAVDEGAIPAEKKLDARVFHAAKSMEPRGLEPLTFWLPARRSPS